MVFSVRFVVIERTDSREFGEDLVSREEIIRE